MRMYGIYMRTKIFKKSIQIPKEVQTLDLLYKDIRSPVLKMIKEVKESMSRDIKGVRKYLIK